MAILLGYVAANAAVAPDENTALGAAVAATVVFTDLLVFGMHYVGLRSPQFPTFLLKNTTEVWNLPLVSSTFHSKVMEFW